MRQTLVTSTLAMLGILAAPLPAGAAPQMGLPAAFHGEWLTEYERCNGPDAEFSSWQISADAMISYEGAADLVKVQRVPGSTASFDVTATVSAGGEAWDSTFRFMVDERRSFMEIVEISGHGGLPAYLFRCADPVPPQFLGEWASDPNDCGREYTNLRLTPAGFIMPEVGERMLRADLAKDNPRELTMEATGSIAGSSFDEQRMLRLSANGQTLDMLNLGQIERASEDPDFKPNPYAQYRDASAPVRADRLVRCPETAE